MHASGHQIASHTWSHQDLSKISTELMQNQIYYNEMALRNILGFFPQYMRPPYSSCNAACTAFLRRAGYHITLFDLDTEDYLHPDAIGISEAYVAGNVTRANKEWLVIGHDIVQQESYRLTEFMLRKFRDRGFRMVTVGECLGDPPSNWYRYPNATAVASNISDAPAPPPQTPQQQQPRPWRQQRHRLGSDSRHRPGSSSRRRPGSSNRRRPGSSSRRRPGRSSRRRPGSRRSSSSSRRSSRSRRIPRRAPR